MAESEMQSFSLSGFPGLEKRVLRALAQLAENVQDPNTQAKATRSLTVKITLHPTDDRAVIAMTATVSSKLAPDNECSAFMDGALRLFPQRQAGDDPRQDEIPAGVTHINRKKEG